MHLAQADSRSPDPDQQEALILLLEDLRRAHPELHLRVHHVRILAKEVSWLLTKNCFQLMVKIDKIT